MERQEEVAIFSRILVQEIGDGIQPGRDERGEERVSKDFLFRRRDLRERLEGLKLQEGSQISGDDPVREGRTSQETRPGIIDSGRGSGALDESFVVEAFQIPFRSDGYEPTLQFLNVQRPGMEGT
ncbi:MAG: hypothetical protein QW328_07775 [Nitrososphaerota archaeon]